MFLSILLTLLAVPALAGQAGAQGTPSPTTAATAQLTAKELQFAREVRQAFRNAVLRGASDSRISGNVASPTNQFAIEVGPEGETVGKAKLSWQLNRINSSVAVILRGPITKQAGVPVTDRGLANGASGTFSYTLNLWQSSVDSKEGSDARNVAPSRTNELDILADVLRQRALGTMSDAFRSTSDPRRAAFELHAENPKLIHLDQTLSLTTQLGAGSKTFKFSELDDPANVKNETHIDKSFSVDFAFTRLTHKEKSGDVAAMDVPHFLLSVGFAQARTFSADPPRQICFPVGVASTEECKSLIVGAPTAATARSIEIDSRIWSYPQKLGFNPHFSYDLEAKTWTSEIGVSYLVLEEAAAPRMLPKLNSKAMTVGVRVGYRSADAGGPYAAVFFGTVLGLN